MKRQVLIFGLCLSAGTVSATFELSDPANENLEERQAAAQMTEERPDESGPLCVTDDDLDRCWCFDRQSGDRLALGEEECRERAARHSEPPEP